MGNAAVLRRNLIDLDATTITASSQLASTPAEEFLKNPHVLNRWFVAGGSSVDLLVDFGSSVDFDTIGIGAPAGDDLTVRFRASITDPTGAAGEVYDTGVLSDQYDSDYLWLPHKIATVKTARYLLITLSGSGTLGAGRLAVGERDEFAINFDPGWSISYVRRSVNSEGDGGQTFVDPRRGYRVLEATFSWLSASERDGFVEAIEVAVINDGHLDMLWMRDVADVQSRTVFWGYMDGDSVITEPLIVFPQAFSKSYRIRERL